jgi:hypothetical protein
MADLHLRSMDRQAIGTLLVLPVEEFARLPELSSWRLAGSTLISVHAPSAEAWTSQTFESRGPAKPSRPRLMLALTSPPILQFDSVVTLQLVSEATYQ